MSALYDHNSVVTRAHAHTHDSTIAHADDPGVTTITILVYGGAHNGDAPVMIVAITIPGLAGKGKGRSRQQGQRYDSRR
jgi:hypothetical protein